MNKFKRDLDEFVGESPRFKEPLKRKIISDMKKEQRPANRFTDFKYVAVLMLLLTVATIFLAVNMGGNDIDPSGPAGSPVLNDPDTVAEIKVFTEYEEPLEVYNYGFDAMDRGNYDYYKHPLLINSQAYPANPAKEVGRGDVVVFEYEFFNGKSRTIARVVGLPGEEVEIIDGQIYINDRKLDTFYGRAHRLGIDTLEEYNEALIEMGAAQNVDSMKETFAQTTEKFKLENDEVFLVGDDWFRGMQEIVKASEIQAEVLGYYVE